jgi:uncharacterized protein YwqG
VVGVLPPAGLLSFFYDSDQRVWGFDPAQDGAWSVLYAAPGTSLSPCAFPGSLPDHGRFTELDLTPWLEESYPAWELSEVDAIIVDRDDRFAYAEMMDESDTGPIHRMLGNPEPVQGDMQLECQLVSHGLYCGNATGYNDPRAAALRPGAVDWRLLMQIDTDDAAGIMWGDVGRIYYWIHRDALAAQRWSDTRLCLQCS